MLTDVNNSTTVLRKKDRKIPKDTTKTFPKQYLDETMLSTRKLKKLSDFYSHA
jgi:hypothetical protein